MKRPRLYIFGFLLAAAVILYAVWFIERGNVARNPVNTSPVRVAVGTWAGYGNVFVAIEKGYFRDLNVVAIVMDDSNSRRAAYSGPGLDIMMSTIDQFVLEAVQGLPGGILAVTDESFGSDGVIARADITSVDHLRGKKIAYTPGLAGEYLLGRALQRAGLQRADVQLVPIDNPEGGLAAFLSGEVDAAVSWEPHLSAAVRDNRGRVLFTSRDISEAIVDILVAKESITARPEVLRAFLDGWLKAGEFMRDHPDEANVIIAKGLSVTANDVAGMMGGLKLADHSRNTYFLGENSSGGTRAAGLFTTAAEFWQATGAIPAAPIAADRIPSPVVEYFRK